MIFLLVFLRMGAVLGFAQTKNFVVIDKSMSENELVKIAANVVPSPQQL